eukprot:CAMPEP_0184490192 /NCGR_PEP_ID=MMETSP0113_2-20130426/17256_1 /TAXON_ID=91329 /ORGANISM="Norrisiella sphaerica, Strain BC52" /LENGTH=699 /DNA_ID=CAMNT_0026873959 /DNA_START=82 /DNA_END=2181 /DNA_ORIENTATION=+
MRFTCHCYGRSILRILLTALICHAEADIAGSSTKALSFEAQYLRSPDVIACQGNKVVELTIKKARLSIGGVNFTSRVYHYNDRAYFPGPTIVLKAGEPCDLRLVNSLPATSHTDHCPYHENAYHCPDTSNLHTHGLHVSPLQDNIATTVNAGDGRHQYHYDVPEDHLMGTHWYHAHKHGSTALQVSGGLHGALIVEPSDSYKLSSDLNTLYAQNARDLVKVMVLSHIWFGASDPESLGLYALQSYDAISREFPHQSINPNYSSVADFYAVNGQYRPVVTQYARDATLWRMIHPSRARVIEVSIYPRAACTVRLLARDGIFHSKSSMDDGRGYIDLDSIVLGQGSRADVAVLCRTTGSYIVNITRRTENDACLGPGASNRFEQAHLFTLRVVAAPKRFKVRPLPSSYDAPLPSYLTNLRVTAAEKTAVPISPRDGRPVPSIKLGRGDTAEGGVNGLSFRGFEAPEKDRYVGVMRVDEVYRVNLIGKPGKNGHPYHHHVNPFQVQAADVCNGQTHRAGEWRDVVFASGQEIRWVNNRFNGDVIVHCHILEHEDRGMMSAYKVCAANETNGVCSQLARAKTHNQKGGAATITLNPTSGITGNKAFSSSEAVPRALIKWACQILTSLTLFALVLLLVYGTLVLSGAEKGTFKWDPCSDQFRDSTVATGKSYLQEDGPLRMADYASRTFSHGTVIHQNCHYGSF